MFYVLFLARLREGVSHETIMDLHNVYNFALMTILAIALILNLALASALLFGTIKVKTKVNFCLQRLAY